MTVYQGVHYSGKGMDLGRDTGRDTGMDTGRDTGMDTGLDAGMDTGMDTGRYWGPPCCQAVRLSSACGYCTRQGLLPAQRRGVPVVVKRPIAVYVR